jgi:hypothetical protein
MYNKRRLSSRFRRPRKDRETIFNEPRNIEKAGPILPLKVQIVSCFKKSCPGSGEGGALGDIEVRNLVHGPIPVPISGPVSDQMVHIGRGLFRGYFATDSEVREKALRGTGHLILISPEAPDKVLTEILLAGHERSLNHRLFPMKNQSTLAAHARQRLCLVGITEE